MLDNNPSNSPIAIVGAACRLPGAPNVQAFWNMLHDAGIDDIHAVLGAHRWSVPAGRISHLLDLRGPSVGIEATCASSLAAVHMAVQAIRTGEVDMAIVGAANLLLDGHDRDG